MDRYRELAKLEVQRLPGQILDPEFEMGRLETEGAELVFMSRQMYENIVGLVHGLIDTPSEMLPGFHDTASIRSPDAISEEQLGQLAQALARQ